MRTCFSGNAVSVVGGWLSPGQAGNRWQSLCVFLDCLFCPLVLQVSNPWGELLLVPNSFWFLHYFSTNYTVNISRWFSCMKPSKVLTHEWVWERCTSCTRLHIKQKHCCGRFSFYLGICVKGSFLTKFWLENFGGSDWPAYWQPVLVTVASCSKNWSSLCIWYLHHWWAARCKLPLRFSNANHPGKAALKFQRAFWMSVLCYLQWETNPFPLMCQSGLQPSGLESRNSWISVDY